MNRRDMLIRSGATALTLGLSRFPLGWTAPLNGSTKKILMFTRSQTYEHSVVKRINNEDSMAERIVNLVVPAGFDVALADYAPGRSNVVARLANGPGPVFAFNTHMDVVPVGSGWSSDPLVLWGWDPGPGRAPVSTSHEELVRALELWVAGGCGCPGD